MLSPANGGTLVADLGSIVFWLLINNKVIGLVSGAVACYLIWRTDGRFKGERALAIGAALYLAIRAIVFLWNYECWDFEVYYQTGTAVVRGTNPYASKLSQYLVNALPIFGLFALLPYRLSSILWYAFNLISLFLVVRLCQVIVRPAKAGGPHTPWYVDAHVTLAVLLAGATTWGLDAGQLVIWTTFWIYIAIRALAVKREVTAGFSLAAASIKITTSFPFLLLVLDRRHWKAWIAFAAVLLALCLCLYPPSRLVELQRSQLANVSQARQVGEINDYSFSGPYHDDMLGLEHWLYCLGLRDPSVISALQLGILALLGLALLWDFRLSFRPRDDLLLAVLLCLYSCIFLYHRSYDAVIVALPLLYCVNRARDSDEARAILYKAIATGLVLVLNFPRGAQVLRFADWSKRSGLAGRLVQIFVLPYCTWIVLFALLLLWFLGRRTRWNEVSHEPSHGSF